ncbi:MAG: branched-chain amino acid ABC transporter substrate-binding protein [Alkalispirochaeta sp.]
MKKTVLGVVLFVPLLILAGCQNPTDSTNDDDQSGSIKIAVVGPHTGDLESFGTPTLRAAELIAASVNADGGVLDRQIEIIAIDDECSTTLADAAAQEALDAGVVGVIGHICSDATATALAVYKARGIPVISPSATKATLTTDGDPFFFRTIASDAEITSAMIDVVVDEGATDIYILYDNTGTYWTDAAIERVEAQIPEGRTHEGTSGIDFENSSAVASAATTIKGSGADGVLLISDIGAGQGLGAVVAPVVNALRDEDFNGPIAITNDAYEQALIDNLDEPADVFVVGDADIPATDDADTFNDEHEEEYGEDAGPYFINGGAALQVLLAAIEETESTAASGLVSAIEDGTFTTALGELSFTDGEPLGERTGYEAYKISQSSFVAYK